MDITQLIDQFNLTTKLEQFWRYGEIFVILFGAYVLRHPLSVGVFSLITVGKSTEEKRQIRQTFSTPLELAIVAFVFFVCTQFVTFVAEISYATHVAGTALMFSGFWAAHRGICAYSDRLQKMYVLVDAGLTQEVAHFVTQVLRFVLVMLGAFSILDFWGINLSALVGGMGILGAAIAFASQDLIKNIFGSLVVLMDQTYRVGDTVAIGKNHGIVEHIGLRTTNLRDSGKALISIPNSTIVNTTVINLSRKVHQRFEILMYLKAQTPNERVQGFSQRMRGYLSTHEWIATDEETIKSPSVSVFGLTSRGVELKLDFFMHLDKGADERLLQESIYLKAKEISETSGVTLC